MSLPDRCEPSTPHPKTRSTIHGPLLPKESGSNGVTPLGKFGNLRRRFGNLHITMREATNKAESLPSCPRPNTVHSRNKLLFTTISRRAQMDTKLRPIFLLPLPGLMSLPTIRPASIALSKDVIEFCSWKTSSILMTWPYDTFSLN